MKMIRTSHQILRSILQQLVKIPKHSITYTQGQQPEPRIREYFYYIDHQGLLFLDDSKMKNFTSCFKEKKFLEFFFKRISLNNSGRYENEFPFLSLCGWERNYIRCDDVPIVYTHIINFNKQNYLTYGNVDCLKVQFLPQKIIMNPETGRVYHPADGRCGGVGLVRSKLAIELCKYFEFRNGEFSPPTHFTWENESYQLDQYWLQENIKKFNIKLKTMMD